MSGQRDFHDRSEARRVGESMKNKMYVGVSGNGTAKGWQEI